MYNRDFVGVRIERVSEVRSPARRSKYLFGLFQKTTLPQPIAGNHSKQFVLTFDFCLSTSIPVLTTSTCVVAFVTETFGLGVCDKQGAIETLHAYYEALAMRSAILVDPPSMPATTPAAALRGAGADRAAVVRNATGPGGSGRGAARFSLTQGRWTHLLAQVGYPHTVELLGGLTASATAWARAWAGALAARASRARCEALGSRPPNAPGPTGAHVGEEAGALPVSAEAALAAAVERAAGLAVERARPMVASATTAGRAVGRAATARARKASAAVAGATERASAAVAEAAREAASRAVATEAAAAATEAWNEVGGGWTLERVFF